MGTECFDCGASITDVDRELMHRLAGQADREYREPEVCTSCLWERIQQFVELKDGNDGD